MSDRLLNGSFPVDLRTGDCLEVMRELDVGSVDAVVTDPPYGIRFMGKTWDGEAIERAARERRDFSGVTRLTGGADSSSRKLIQRTGSAYANAAGEAGAYDFSLKGNRAFQAWCEEWAAECLRVLKPGGHLLAFGGTRTYHRLACAIEDASFEIRDTVAWLYGSGFPKSLDVSKAIDKAAGAEREVVGHSPHNANRQASSYQADETIHGYIGNPEGDRLLTEPTTEDAHRWNGWGTALKPAHEPIVVARKPLTGTVAANVLEHGAGALNVDGCRVETVESEGRPGVFEHKGQDAKTCYGDGLHGSRFVGNTTLGRWPANVVLDEEAAAMLDEQTGELASGKMMPTPVRSGERTVFGQDAHAGYTTIETYGDSGGASRFFYVAKASRAERNAGLAGFEERVTITEPGEIDLPASERGRATRNHHPTVKPVALMRWLVRLITPPNGLVVDPFCGSGTTGIACALERFRFLGIERDEDYARIAQARIRFWAEHGEDALRIVAERERADEARAEIASAGQLGLFEGVA